MKFLTQPSDQPIRSLVVLFSIWKLLLLLIAVCSPGPGYDTSSVLALSQNNGNAKLPQSLNHLAQRLTRWDAIYFVTIAKRGYVYEQEWAFGYGFTKLVTLCTTGLYHLGFSSLEGLESIVASLIAHVAHVFSVIVLFKLTLAVFGRASKQHAFLASVLHIISPAGLFLSAPYAESCCAFLSFAGCLYYVKSFSSDGEPSGTKDIFLLMAGIMFGAATTFRSNGILNGVILLEEALTVAYQFLHDYKLVTLRRLVATGMGGLTVATGFVLPQFIAYQEYCKPSTQEFATRAWCQKSLPSIYSFVQEHYWNVGLFRYWTISNLPLFLLAAPMYFLFMVSATWALGLKNVNASRISDKTAEGNKLLVIARLRSLAIPQLLLTIINLTTAHVQIITRISSAYPVWLWYMTYSRTIGNENLKYMIQFMVIYAFIQGGLFASFLPPA